MFQKIQKLCNQCGSETTIVQLGSKTFLFDAADSKIYFTKNNSLVQRQFGHSEGRPGLVLQQIYCVAIKIRHTSAIPPYSTRTSDGFKLFKNGNVFNTRMARVREEPSNERRQYNYDFYEPACINNTRLPKKTYTEDKLNTASTSAVCQSLRLQQKCYE